jgi:hypothetical protein
MVIKELREMPDHIKDRVIAHLTGIKLVKPVSCSADYQHGLYDGFEIAVNMFENSLKYMLYAR